MTPKPGNGNGRKTPTAPVQVLDPPAARPSVLDPDAKPARPAAPAKPPEGPVAAENRRLKSENQRLREQIVALAREGADYTARVNMLHKDKGVLEQACHGILFEENARHRATRAEPDA